MNARASDDGTVESLSWQFATFDRRNGDEATGSVPDLERALMVTDPTEMASLLYRAVLGRAPEGDSKAAESLAQGLLTPVLLAQSLLDSHEGRALGAERRRALSRDLADRRFLEVWGLPTTGSLDSFVTSPDVPLILAGYRVGLGRPPAPTELADGRRLLAEGLGRERFLRVIWREPGTKARVFGQVDRDMRGLVRLARRPRRFSSFVVHVLAHETALHGAIMALHLDARTSADTPLTMGGDHRTHEWQTLARINEISAGVRRLTGDPGW